jgi:hypothetical protein
MPQQRQRLLLLLLLLLALLHQLWGRLVRGRHRYKAAAVGG